MTCARDLSRRELIRRVTAAFGGAGAAALLGRFAGATNSKALPVASGGLADLPHHAPRAKRIIYLFMNGAPTHVDIFDYKPKLTAMHGKPVPQSYLGDKRFSTMTGNPKGKVLLAPIEPFHRRGESGAWVSDLMPYTAAIADELCFVKGLHTEAVNHAPAINFFLSGSEMPGRPSLGAWLGHALGSDAENLPPFVVMTSVSKGTTCGQIFYDFYWGSGFLPSRHQGVKFRAGRDPVLFLSNPPGVSRRTRRGILDDLAKLNQMRYEEFADPEIQTRTAQYEMAYRMQESLPELADLSDEPQHVLDMYGPDVLEPGTFAHHCLMARRLTERGVRCVQVMHAGWDQHNSITTELYTQCKDTDRSSAALVMDLKQRGLLDDTLVIWGGEFGRTPFIQGDLANPKRWGRDHHPYAFTKWMAGGGTRRGLSFGETDDLAMNVVKDAVHVHDFQATVLHLLGIDHERLTYRHQGRNYRLTDVHGHVVSQLLA
jgi:hypothetical protein